MTMQHFQSDLNTSVSRNSIKLSKVGNKIAPMKDNKTVGEKLESPKNWNAVSEIEKKNSNNNWELENSGRNTRKLKNNRVFTVSNDSNNRNYENQINLSRSNMANLSMGS